MADMNLHVHAWPEGQCTWKILRVKASGFATPRHPKDLRIVLGFAPKSEQHQVGFTERKVLRARAAVIEDVLVQERIKLVKGDVEIASGLGFCIELFDWFERSGHSFYFPYPYRSGCGGARCLYLV